MHSAAKSSERLYGMCAAPVCPAMFSTENSVELAPSAPMGSYVWTAEAPGIYYFACQVLPESCYSICMLCSAA